MIVKLALRIMEFTALLALGTLLLYLSIRYQQRLWSIATIVLATIIFTVGIGNTFRKIR